METENWGGLKQYWYVACESRELRNKPLSRRVLGQPLVLFRDQQGKPTALLDRCPHRNMPLSMGWMSADRLVCRYHGWQFDREGHCQEIPGRCDHRVQPQWNAIAYETVEQDGWVWVYGQERTSLPMLSSCPPRVPLLDQPGTGKFRFRLAERVSVLNAAENFLDGLHTHFVHRGLIRGDLLQQTGTRQKVQVQITRTEHQVEAVYEGETALSGLIYRLLGVGSGPLVSIGRFIMPGMAQLEYRINANNLLFVTLFLTSETEHQVSGYGVVTFRWGLPNWLAVAIAVPLFSLAARQDRWILRRQAQNIERFGTTQFVSTELDVIRSHLEILLNGVKAGKSVTPGVNRVDMWL